MQASGYPTLKAIYKGKEVKSFEGDRNLSALKTFIEEVAKEPTKTNDFHSPDVTVVNKKTYKEVVRALSSGHRCRRVLSSDSWLHVTSACWSVADVCIETRRESIWID